MSPCRPRSERAAGACVRRHSAVGACEAGGELLEPVAVREAAFLREEHVVEAAEHRPASALLEEQVAGREGRKPLVVAGDEVFHPLRGDVAARAYAEAKHLADAIRLYRLPGARLSEVPAEPSTQRMKER
jgi:hypothetical protein